MAETLVVRDMSIGDWSHLLDGVSKKQYFVKLLSFLNEENFHNKTIFPPSSEWFMAFELTSFSNTKIVILGQDPYHGYGQAHGLSFSVKDNIKIPPSLRNIFKEIEDDLGITQSQNGNLTAWAEQGVLLLNSVLTVEKNSPGSHSNKGWEIFTDSVIKLLNNDKANIVFMLWGAYAQKKSSLIDQNKHLILTSPHPSPFSAHTGFFGSKHFSKANKYLESTKQQTINWKL
ncbi:MAG: uracil-DNA glycosylase [PS1 clade bacterium]|jgi:uracil-DNA glycosylase